MVVPRRRPLRYLLLSVSVIFFIWYFVIPVQDNVDLATPLASGKSTQNGKSASDPTEQPDTGKVPSLPAQPQDIPTQTSSADGFFVTQDAKSLPASELPPQNVTKPAPGSPAPLKPAEEEGPVWSETKAAQEPLEQDVETVSERKSTGPPKYQRPAANATFYQIGKNKFYPKHVPSTLQELSGTAKELPILQHIFEKETEDAKQEREDRRESIRDAFKYAWSGYRNQSWMEDEIMPISGEGHSAFGGWAATLVDSLDTLWIMGMKTEFEEAVRAASDIDFSSTRQGRISVFETTIRYLGGFLGAYDISEGKYPVLLEKAKEVGNLLFCAFDTPNHMPVTSWGWQAALDGANQQASFSTILADIGSLTLEFTRLSQLTGDMRFYDGITRISTALQKSQSETRIPGLWPSNFDANTLNFNYHEFTLGALADSTYEYLPKQHMLMGGTSELVRYDSMYKSAVTAAMDHLIFRPMLPNGEDILFTGNTFGDKMPGDNATTKIDAHASHLACFAGAMVGVGAKLFAEPDQLDVARKLTNGCIWAYTAQPSGIMPENLGFIPCESKTNCEWDDQLYNTTIQSIFSLMTPVKYNEDNEPIPREETDVPAEQIMEEHRLIKGLVDVPDRRYLLRPEAIESVFVLYRLTGEREFMERAWNMFVSIMDATSTIYANAAVEDVTKPRGENGKVDNMESFWMAETLKYFFLIFSEPDVVSLDEWVLNTEAHTFRRPRAGESLVQIPKKVEDAEDGPKKAKKVPGVAGKDGEAYAKERPLKTPPKSGAPQMAGKTVTTGSKAGGLAEEKVGLKEREGTAAKSPAAGAGAKSKDQEAI